MTTIVIEIDGAVAGDSIFEQVLDEAVARIKEGNTSGGAAGFNFEVESK